MSSSPIGWPRSFVVHPALGYPRTHATDVLSEAGDAYEGIADVAADAIVSADVVVSRETPLGVEAEPTHERVREPGVLAPHPEPNVIRADAQPSGAASDSSGDESSMADVTETEPQTSSEAVSAGESTTTAEQPPQTDMILPEASSQTTPSQTSHSQTSPSQETDPPAPPTKRRVSRETLPRPAHPRLLVVANQKGGVGKTTTAVNLASALARGGLRVLLVDLDPQGNASTALGVAHDQGVPGTYEVLIDGEPIADHVVESSESPELLVLPATIDLAGAEIALVSAVARENKLAKAIRAFLSTHETDYVFFDCPPSLGLLTLNALVAASEILIPIQCEYYALEGVSQLMRTINLVKGELNDDLALSTVVLTMFDARTKLASQVAEEVHKHFPEQTIGTMVPRSVRISEAPSYGQTVVRYDPQGMGAKAYIKIAAEMARRGAQEES